MGTPNRTQNTADHDRSLVPSHRLRGKRGTSTRDRRAFPAPRYLYLRVATSNICNYRCKHCHIWMNQDPRNALSTERRVQLLEEFSGISPGGMVEFPGGEVTLAFDELCELASHCRRLGLNAGVVSNGSQLQTLDSARRLVDSGLSRITISLDSHDPAIHDYIRGVPGAFEQATRALRLLVKARNQTARLGTGPAIQSIAVLFDKNITTLTEFVEFCRDLGVEEINFQILNRTFARTRGDRDSFFERHFFHDEEAKRKAVDALAEVVELYADDPIVKPGTRDLHWLSQYILRPDTTPEGLACGSFFRNAIVDTDGEVSLCFNQPTGAPGSSIGNILETPLKDVLQSDHARQMRSLMQACAQPCGALECHRAVRMNPGALRERYASRH